MQCFSALIDAYVQYITSSADHFPLRYTLNGYESNKTDFNAANKSSDLIWWSLVPSDWAE